MLFRLRFCSMESTAHVRDEYGLTSASKNSGLVNVVRLILIVLISI